MKKLLVPALALLLTTSAFARGGGRGPGGDDGAGPGGNAIVADNGTIIVTRVVTDSATNTRTTQLVAITPAGAQAWTATLTDRGHLVLSGNNLLSVSQNDAGVSTITARSIATGATAWTATVNGRVTDLEPFNGGTYAIVVVPPATEGGTATRRVVAISNSGTTLWTVNL